jgi:cytochrome c
MKIRNALFIAAGLLAGSLPVHASTSGFELVRRFHCMGCHAVDKAAIGPSFRQIGASWRGKPGAEQALAGVIRRGSEASGGPHWGDIKMPDDSEREQISDQQARRIARWILRQP